MIIEKLNAVSKYVYLTVSICLILAIVTFGFKKNSSNFEEMSLQSLNHFDQAYDKNIELTKTGASSYLTENQKSILLSKISIIEENKSYHLDLIKLLYKNNYALLTLLPFMSAITAILAFLMIQKGWNGSNLYLKTYFILFTTLTGLVGIYPEVYQQSQSIEKNVQNYLSYKKIQKSIFNYSLTAPILEKESFEFIDFIDKINTQEKKLTNLIFSIKKKTFEKDMFETN
tara:strand:+ start:1708 stop:2394 length:687 start_codon:yes stop_codon:yes gene_type:complete